MMAAMAVIPKLGLAPLGLVQSRDLTSLPGSVFAWFSMFAIKRAREELLRIVASDPVSLRPNRSEPRARKRRPKPYQFLTQPRHQMVVSPSRALK